MALRMAALHGAAIRAPARRCRLPRACRRGRSGTRPLHRRPARGVVRHAREPRVLHHWVSLVQALAARAAQPVASDDKLAALWATVEQSLDQWWSLEMLAAQMHSSPEALRKRCLRELGRSPVQQVTYMRMQRAQHLLETRKDKLEVIAKLVGFTDALTFSRAFKRWIGCTPGDYRQRH